MPAWKLGVAAEYIVLCQALGILVIRYSLVLCEFMVLSLQSITFARNPEQIHLSQDLTISPSTEDTQRKELHPVWNRDQYSGILVL